MTGVDCLTCKDTCRCQARYEMHRVALFAAANDRPVPACPFYSPAFERGVDGVLLHRSPRPSLRFSGVQR